MTIRLVASDLDGTLFGADHRPEPRTVAAVNRLAAEGIVIAAVTGRSWMHGLALAQSTGGHFDWFIGSNGGHRVEVATGQVHERLVFAADDLGAWLRHLEGELGPLGFGFEHAEAMGWSPRFVEMHPTLLDGTSRQTGPDRPLSDVGKFFVAHPDRSPVEMIDLVSSVLPPGVVVTTSGVGSVEVTPPGGDKGPALSRLCARLGIEAHEVIAFGDNLNDVSMLRWAGRGVAMGNAVAAATAAADESTASNVDFGVAKVLEQL